MSTEGNYKGKFKVAVCGDSGVGKTALIEQLFFGTFPQTHNPTIGMEFNSKRLEVEAGHARLQVWDMAGQARFASLIPGYLKDSAVALVVYDVTRRESFVGAAQWLQQAKANAKAGALIFLVGNKADLLDARDITMEEGSETALSEGVLFTEISATDGPGVFELFQRVTACVLDPEAAKPSLVVVLHASPRSGDSLESCQWELQFTGLGGEELAAPQVRSGKVPLGEIRAALAAELRPGARLRLLQPDGQELPPSADEAMLDDVLDRDEGADNTTSAEVLNRAEGADKTAPAELAEVACVSRRAPSTCRAAVRVLWRCLGG